MVSNGLTLHYSKSEASSIAPFIHKSSPSLSLNLCNNIVNTTNTAKYLVILTHDQLSFKSHINFFEKKLSRSVGIMAKLSYHLFPNSLLTLYHSLVHVHFIYALPVWATTFPTYLIKLKRLQSKGIRIITKIFPMDRISQHYCRLQILKLDDLYKFEVAKLMHQFTHKKIPDIFCQYFTYSNDIFKYSTRNSANYNLYFLQFSSDRAKRSIKYVSVKILNNIPSRSKQFSYPKSKCFYK